MSKDKITAQDIIEMLASKDGRTKRIAEDFFRAFISTIEEELLKNESVKIKELGTFKLQWVAPRKSVNVQTGEDIVIDGYYKVSFSPDNNLKEVVNLPFAHLESVTLDDDGEGVKQPENPAINPLATLEEQASEIKDILSELRAMPSVPQETNEEATDHQEDVVEPGPEIIIEETPIIDNIDVQKSKTDEPKHVNEAEAIVNNAPPKVTIISQKRRQPWPCWILLIIVFLLIVFLLLYCYNPKVNTWVNSNMFRRELVGQVADQPVENTTNNVDNTVDTQVSEENTFNDIFNKRLENPEYIATVKMPKGSRLARLSSNYYGSPYFWVYIYEANNDKMEDPNMVLPDMEIRIPKLDPRLTDICNPLALKKAKDLADVYLKK